MKLVFARKECALHKCAYGSNSVKKHMDKGMRKLTRVSGFVSFHKTFKGAGEYYYVIFPKLKEIYLFDANPVVPSVGTAAPDILFEVFGDLTANGVIDPAGSRWREWVSEKLRKIPLIGNSDAPLGIRDVEKFPVISSVFSKGEEAFVIETWEGDVLNPFLISEAQKKRARALYGELSSK